MDWLTWCTSDCAYWETLGGFLCCAVITCSDTLLDDLNLTIETSGTTFNERNISSQAHLIHMSSRLQIIQRIENHCEPLEPGDIELGVFNVGMVSLEFDIWIEGMRRLFRNLFPIYISPAQYEGLRWYKPKLSISLCVHGGRGIADLGY